MGNNIILSLCIPTNGVVEWVLPVVESIYSQDVNNNLYEVIITDNGSTDDLCNAIKDFKYSNLHYYQTKAQGFENQTDAFEKCNGIFCKMLNHRSVMMPGSINALIALVEKYVEKKPIIYCAEGTIDGDEIIECQNTDEFVKNLSYRISWSAGVGAWKEDLVSLRCKNVDKMFPHTLFLFELREESQYIIWNKKYEKMSNDAGKGGYDLFLTFSVNFLDIINNLRIKERISNNTFVKVKKDLYKFLCLAYFWEKILPTKHTFILQNIAGSMAVYYGYYYYIKMIFIAYCCLLPKAICKKMLHR